MSLLEKINSPADLKTFTLEELQQLAGDVRAFMVSVVSETGGHLASSLGAVELTLALHRVFDTPKDRLVWDVGHQTYAHKLITGRRDRFRSLRQMDGLSGFPKREESPYDVFNAGHSSTSISAALGLARARDLAGGNHKVVAVIGDGSLSNGLALEALNDAGHSKTDLLVLLNDNRMSISKPVGGLSNYLNRLITGTTYNRLKPQIDQLLAKIPAVGRQALKLTNYLEEIIKGLIVPGILFEEWGFRYLGPVPGHDLEQLLMMLERVKTLSGPILLHVLTTKGKGFEHAEKNPTLFHGISRFDAATGQTKRSSGTSYSKAFADSLLRMARTDDKVVAIVAAMTSGTALDDFAAELPQRFFDVGIAESHAVTMAAGLAAGGRRPVVTVYSTFLQRAYDQILHDVCLQNLPVIFALDRAGVVGEDGPTHHGIFDIAYLRHMPNMSILAPGDEEDLAEMLAAGLRHSGPVAIRYPRGKVIPAGRAGRAAFAWGRGRQVRPGKDAAIVAVGPMLAPALAAADQLAAAGIETAVIDPRTVKPLDAELLAGAGRRTGLVVTVEDHALAGGFGSAVLELFQAEGLKHVVVERVGWPDRFIEQGTREQLLEKYGLTAAGIAAKVLAHRPPQPSGKKKVAVHS